MDDLMKSLEISASGMRVQSDRLRVIAQNIANADSTGDKPGEDPYRRKTISFKSELDRHTGIDKVVVHKYDKDKSDFRMVYNPNHPAANTQGYVALPNVDRIIEDMDAKEAQRSYEANLNAIEISKAMLSKTIDVLRSN
jgi:flagellar basal-body rod protein FlgC